MAAAAFRTNWPADIFLNCNICAGVMRTVFLPDGIFDLESFL